MEWSKLPPQLYYLLCISLIFSIGFWIWSYQTAYPLLLQSLVKKGKSWLYIPQSWTPSKRKWVFPMHLLLLLCSLSFASITTYKFWEISLNKGFLFIGFAWLLIILGLKSFLFRSRYMQQENVYFFFLDQLKLEEQNSLNPLNDSQFTNMASYKHQSYLREAEESQSLHKALKEQSKKYFEQKKSYQNTTSMI